MLKLRARFSVIAIFALLIGAFVVTVPDSANAAGTVSHTISVPTEPDALVAAGPNIWVASCSGNAITEIDRSTYQVLQTITSAAYDLDCPDALAVVGSDIWVANRTGNSITELNASSGQFLQNLTGSEIVNPVALALAGPDVWVANASLNTGAGTLSEIQASTGAVLKVVVTPNNYAFSLTGICCVVSDGTGIWVAAGNNRPVEFNSSGTYLRAESRSPTGEPGDLVYRDGVLWVAETSNGSVQEVDATTGRYLRTITTVRIPYNVALLSLIGNHMFLVVDGPMTYVREYTIKGSFVKTIPGSARPNSDGSDNGISAIEGVGSDLWIASFNTHSVTAFSLIGNS